MKDSKVEKKLKRAAKKVKVKPFSQVWKEIEPDLDQELVLKEKKRKRKIIYSLVSFATCLVLICSITIPIVLTNQKEMVFFADELISESVNEIDFFNGISNSNLEVVDFNRYDGEGFWLYKTDKDLIKGGKFEFYNDLDFPAYRIELKFIAFNVQEREEIEYNENYSVNGAEIYYQFKGTQNSFWVYEAKASYNKVNYYMKISALSQDVIPFFNEFFA